MTISPIQQTGNYSGPQGAAGAASSAPDLFSAMLAMLKGAGAAEGGEALTPFKPVGAEGEVQVPGLKEGKEASAEVLKLMDLVSAPFAEKVTHFLDQLDALGIAREEIKSFDDLTLALKEAGLNELEIKKLVDNAFELVKGLEEELNLLYAQIDGAPLLRVEDDAEGSFNLDQYLEILTAAVVPAPVPAASHLVAETLAEEGSIIAPQKTHSGNQQHTPYSKNQPVMDLEVRVSRGESLLPETAVQADSAPEAIDIAEASSRDESAALERAANKEVSFGNENTQVLYRLQSSGNAQGGVEALNLVVEQEGEGALLEEAVDGIDPAHRVENRIPAVKDAGPLARTAARADVGAQVGAQVRILTEQGGGQIKMTLNPAELGEIDISLEVSNGRVSGTITAQNVEVVEQLARDLRTLEQSLAQAGLNLGEEGISFQLQGEGAGQNEQGEKGNAQIAEAEGAETFEQENGAWINPERILDIRV